MKYQSIFIIIIIIFFNILLLNIFRLQNEIYNIKFNDKPLTGILDENIETYGVADPDPNVNKKLNEIANLVPIDVNKLEKSKDVLLPKYKQIKHI
jgi:hypothetical protein|tara:strand:- start:139 stop:423 length:285 start_codon:yes stop_codon:yes gene_type:complete